jgi:hypothetical protein
MGTPRNPSKLTAHALASTYRYRARTLKVANMKYEQRDFLGWILPVAAALLAVFGAVTNSALLIATGVVLLAINERRSAKVVTAALIRVADENGNILGLVGWAGGGLQIGVRTEEISSNAISYFSLWGNTPSVDFTFQGTKSATAAGLFECSPSIHVSGMMPGRAWRTYSLNFSYAENGSEPRLSVSEHHKEGVVRRSIPLS